MMTDLPSAKRQVDVVIVGAGLSGLTAAYHLQKSHPTLKFCVLEAKDRVGGRTLTLTLRAKTGRDEFDLGGQWVGTSQKYIMALIEELGLETYPQETEGACLLQVVGDNITSYSSDTPSLPVLSLIDLKLFMNKVERFRKTVDPAHPFECPRAEEWDNTTLETFLRQNIWTDAALEYCRVLIRGVTSIEPSEQSVLSVMASIAGCGGLDPMMGVTEDSAQGLKVKGGTQQISTILTERIGVENVLLEHPVDTVVQNENQVTVTCRNGFSATCRRVIIATPPPATNKIIFKPLLHVEHREINKRYVFGNYIKVIVTYEEDFWIRKGYSGDVETNGGPSHVTGCDRGPITIVMDTTSHRGSPALVVFIAGEQARQWGKQNEPTRRTAVLESLSIYFGKEALSPLDYCERDWSKETFIEGALASLGTGAMKSYEKGIGIPFMRTHFAGTETAVEWDGNMTGAVEAGIRAANEVLCTMRNDQ